MSLGDFDTSAVVYFKFTTFRPSTGAPYTLAGTPALSVYKDNSTTQSTSGVTLTADFDSVTGLNHVAVDTSADGTFYAAGSFFDVVITTGTVDSISAVGTVVGRFTLRKTACLKPTTAGRSLDVSSGGEAGLDWANIGSPTTTVNLSGTSTKALEPTTAGRTLDVSAGGEAGIDWANVGSPTTSLNLSGTTISTSQVVASVSGAVGSVTGAVGSVTGNVGGNVVGSVASVTAAVTVGTNNDKTGYSLTQTFPANFASLGINVSGHISRVTLVDTTTTNTDMRGTDSAALASAWTATRAGYLDSVLIAANANQRTVSVTGSQHVAADIHETQPGSIHAATFDAGAIDAAALATDAATEIATAVYTGQMTESYRAAGVAPTLAQVAFELIAHMGDSAISGTTKTLKKIDGTTAKTFTLDSATTPTSITEAT